MKNKILIHRIMTLFVISFLMLVCSNLLSSRERNKVISFQDFILLMKDKKNIKIQFDGRLHESFFTKKKYIHYETTAFLGESDISSTHQILYNTDKEFYVKYKDMTIKIHHSKIRTHLTPAFMEKYSKNDLVGTKEKREQELYSIMKINDSDHLLLEEYGLLKGKDYYASFINESYLLPPGKNGKPKRRNNIVLKVSDKPLPNKLKQTPLYRGWIY